MDEPDPFTHFETHGIGGFNSSYMCSCMHNARLLTNGRLGRDDSQKVTQTHAEMFYKYPFEQQVQYTLRAKGLARDRP